MTVISFVSAKGGVGKTTVVANLGAVLVKNFGKNVLAIDGNITTPTLGIQFGIVPKDQTLTEVLKNEIPVEDAIYMHHSGINMMPSSLMPSSYYPEPDGIKEKIDEIREKYDYILIDGAAGIGKEVISVMEASDSVFVVSTSDLAAAVSALKIIKISEILNVKVLGIILNKTTKSGYEMSIQEFEELCGKSVLCSIPFDINIPESLAKQTPVVLEKKNSVSRASFMKIGSFLTREPYEKDSLISKILGIFRLRRYRL